MLDKRTLRIKRRQVSVSIQFSCSVMSDCDPMGYSMPDFLVHHQLSELAQDSYTLTRWWNQAISSSVALFSSCLWSFPAALGSFPMSQIFPSGGQSIIVSASVSALPMNIQDLFPLGLVGLIFLKSKGLSRIFSNIAVLFCFVLFFNTAV